METGIPLLCEVALVVPVPVVLVPPGFVKLLPLPQPPLRARTDGRTDKSKRLQSHPTKECDRARVRCRKTEP
jgi:hypothetical protein